MRITFFYLCCWCVALACKLRTNSHHDLAMQHANDMLVKQIRRIETPDIARATAISLISPYLDQSNISVLQKGLKDSNAMVRLASISGT